MSIWYLASPYSLYEAGIEAAYDDACAEAALLLEAGVPVVSPIAHTHGIAKQSTVDALDCDFWLKADKPLMDAAKGIIVCKLEGWDVSKGVAFEIAEFERQGKPVIFMEPGEVPWELLPRLGAQSWIAFTGYSRTGKDTAGQALVDEGYSRRCFGDIIKRRRDGYIKQHYGFSAFTENDAEKALIRHELESFGDLHYAEILDEFMRDLPSRTVNTRLCRAQEAKEWRRLGGTIIEITRPGVGPLTEWERDTMNELRESGLIDLTIANDGTPADLHAKILGEVLCGSS